MSQSNPFKPGPGPLPPYLAGNPADMLGSVDSLGSMLLSAIRPPESDFVAPGIPSFMTYVRDRIKRKPCVSPYS